MPCRTQLLRQLWPALRPWSRCPAASAAPGLRQTYTSSQVSPLQIIPSIAYSSASAHSSRRPTAAAAPAGTAAAAAASSSSRLPCRTVTYAAASCLHVPGLQQRSWSSSGAPSGSGSSNPPEGRILSHAHPLSDEDEPNSATAADNKQDFSEVLQRLHRVTSTANGSGTLEGAAAAEAAAAAAAAAAAGAGGGTSASASGTGHTGPGDTSDAASVLGYQHGAGEERQRLRFRRQQPKFEVIEFREDGSAIELYGPRTPQELGLHPRDVTLFAPLSRLAAPQRATISVREDKILFKTEVAKAIITHNKAILIKGRRLRDTKRLAHDIITANDARIMQLEDLKARTAQRATAPGLGSCERAASAADLRRATMGKALSGGAGPSLGLGGGMGSKGGGGDDKAAAGGGAGGLLGRAVEVPFEFVVMEVLLDATTEYFYNKSQHLNWMMESLSDEIRTGPRPFMANDKAHQLVPIQKFLTAIKNDVRETCEAIKELLEDDEALAELCLTWRHQQHRPPAWAPLELDRRGAAAAATAASPLHPPPEMFHEHSYSHNGHGDGEGNGHRGGGGERSHQHGSYGSYGGLGEGHRGLHVSAHEYPPSYHQHQQAHSSHISSAGAAAASVPSQGQRSSSPPSSSSSSSSSRGWGGYYSAATAAAGGSPPGSGASPGGGASAQNLIQHAEDCDQHYVVRRPPPAHNAAPPVAPLYTKVPEHHLRMVTEMLESYEREIHSIEGSLREAEENLENTRQMWHMQLDSSRNHIILINLWLSMISISVMAATIVPAFFGMNLGSGLPDNQPGVFYSVCATSLVLAGVSFPLARRLFIRHWQRLVSQDQHEQRMLKVLLVQHLDDLDDIIAALRPWQDKRLDRRQFKRLVTGRLGPRAMSPSNIDFMWSIFDKNHDGFLSTAKLMKALAEQSKDFMPPADTQGTGSPASSSSSSRYDDMPVRSSPAGGSAGMGGARAAAAAAGVAGMQHVHLTDSDDDDWSWDKYRDV